MLVFAMAASLTLSAARAVMALVSKPEAFSAEPKSWVKSHSKALKACDELLAVSSFSFSIYIILLLLQSGQDNAVASAVVVVSLLYCDVAWISTVLTLGNMCYPVNGIQALGGDALSTAALQVYSKMHLSDLSLGVLTVSLASLSADLPVQLTGYAVGASQIVLTYYGKPIRHNAYIFSVIAWCIWMVSFQLTIR